LLELQVFSINEVQISAKLLNLLIVINRFNSLAEIRQSHCLFNWRTKLPFSDLSARFRLICRPNLFLETCKKGLVYVSVVKILILFFRFLSVNRKKSFKLLNFFQFFMSINFFFKFKFFFSFFHINREKKFEKKFGIKTNK